MTKTRVLLGLLVLGLSLGGAVLWVSNLEFGMKVLLTVFGSIFWLAACSILALDIFSLDDRGRVAYGSLGWKFLSLHFASMPSQLKVCPMYWLMVLYLFLTVAALAAVSLLVSFLYLFISGLITGKVSNVAFLIIIAVVIWIILFFGSLTKAEKGKYKFVPLVLLAMPVLAVISLLVYLAYLGGMTLLSAIISVLIKAIFLIGIVAGVLLALTLAASILILFSIYIGRLFGGMKNNLIGQLASATYNKLCPVITIEQARESKESDRERWDWSG